jgi:hypothetical protein
LSAFGVLVSCYCDKIPDINNLKDGRIYFDLCFQKLEFMDAGYVAFRPVPRQNIMTKERDGAKLLTSGNRKQRVYQKGQGQFIPLKVMPR